jgi:DNA-binding SARP family transcriptional activator
VYISGVLWPDSSEQRAAASLRSTLWRLHRVPYRLVESIEGRLCIASSVTVDVAELCQRATSLIKGTVEPDVLDVERIARGGELLPDWYDDWLLVERERFRQLRLHALEILCLRLASSGMFALAVEAGLAAVAGEPLRESAHRCLIRAYIAERNIGEAMRQYERYRDLMRLELNLPPSSEMQMLIREEIEASRSQPAAVASSVGDWVPPNATITLP